MIIGVEVEDVCVGVVAAVFGSEGRSNAVGKFGIWERRSCCMKGSK